MPEAKLTRTQRGRARRLRRRLALTGEAVFRIMPCWPAPSLLFIVGPADGSRVGRHFREMDEHGQWDEWISNAQDREQKAITEHEEPKETNRFTPWSSPRPTAH